MDMNGPSDFGFSSDFRWNTSWLLLEALRPERFVMSWWCPGEIIIHKFAYTNHVQTEKIFFVLDKIYSKSEISTKNRIWTHRDQFSADFGVRGLYLRRRHCIRPLLGVTDSRRPIKPVWIDQIEWEDPARTCLCVITRRSPETKIESKRLRMSHKRLVLGLIVCEIPFERT